MSFDRSVPLPRAEHSDSLFLFAAVWLSATQFLVFNLDDNRFQQVPSVKHRTTLFLLLQG